MPARGLGKKYQGQKWIRNEKRLALYLRDGLACCYCGATIEDGVRLTLDHLTPHSEGGSNQAENLVTACQRCNSSRGTRPVEEFANAVANYLDQGITGKQITSHIQPTTTRALSLVEAKELIARRGGFTKALKG